MNCLNIRQYFDDVYTIDRIKNKKNKSEVLSCLLNEKSYNPENTILLGDTVSDMKSAKKTMFWAWQCFGVMKRIKTF